MKVFISWSGNKSHKVALVFREWLPSVIQSLEPYVSSEDIDKGARWSSDIAKELEDSTFGILCVTKENLNAPWLSFEAGALSKTMDKSFVTPFLFNIKRAEVNGPILQFQSTIFEKDDIKKLIHTLNKACGETGISEQMLDKAFDVWYPTLEEELNKIRDLSDNISDEIMEEKDDIHSLKIIEEILELSRDNQKLLRNPDTTVTESVKELKEKIDLSLSRLERREDRGREEINQKYKRMFLEEFMHTILPRCQKQYGFLIALSIFQDDYPWIYNMGKQLIEVLQSNAKVEVKRESIKDFRYILERTSEHPMMREYYGRTKEKMMQIREMPYIFNEIIEALQMEFEL